MIIDLFWYGTGILFAILIVCIAYGIYNLIKVEIATRYYESLQKQYENELNGFIEDIENW